MIRRSFRIGLLLGLLGGVAFALAKVFGARPDAHAPSAGLPSEPWPRLATDPAAPVPAPPPTPEPAAAYIPFVPDPAAPSPVAPMVEEAVVEPQPPLPLAPQPPPEPGPEPEPRPRPAPAPEPQPEPAPAPVAAKAPAKKAPVKKAPVKEAPVKKKAPVKKAPVKKAPAKKAAAKKKAPVKSWVDPAGGVCPTSHPVKAKLASNLFHLPGMFNYERTKPDRCYVDADKAEADGLRASRR